MGKRPQASKSTVCFAHGGAQGLGSDDKVKLCQSYRSSGVQKWSQSAPDDLDSDTSLHR